MRRGVQNLRINGVHAGGAQIVEIRKVKLQNIRSIRLHYRRTNVKSDWQGSFARQERVGHVSLKERGWRLYILSVYMHSILTHGHRVVYHILSVSDGPRHLSVSA